MVQAAWAMLLLGWTGQSGWSFIPWSCINIDLSLVPPLARLWLSMPMSWRLARSPISRVANLLLGGGKSSALDHAINTTMERGIHVAVAAGNDNEDACNYSPTTAKLAVTIGASTLQDGHAYFSNWGRCVDVFAPGLNIRSNWNTGLMQSTQLVAPPWPLLMSQPSIHIEYLI